MSRYTKINKDELISKQQLEIEDLNQKINEMFEGAKEITNMLYSVGGPLNDNCLNFNRYQRDFLRRIEGRIYSKEDFF